MSAAGVRLLVLGGTAWLGGHVTRAALQTGHQVTCLARGASGRVPAGAVFVPGDRTRPGAYEQVAGEQWDVVIDLSRQPGQVRSAAAALADRTALFGFVSSISVYADHREPGQDEDGALLPASKDEVMQSMAGYGQAKGACEQHVLRSVGPDRALIARVGLIGGPGDVSDRSGYWPLRFAHPATRDGAVLVPGAPDLPTQVIDVRDLSDWLVDATSCSTAGVFNVTGPTVPLAKHLDIARSVAAHTGPVVAADQRWLLAHGVHEWMGERSLPLWIADPDWLGSNARDSGKARHAGLTTRPLDQTLADTLKWEMSRERGRVRQAGLSDEDERTLLTALRRS